MSAHRQHPYGQTGRHRAPEAPRPHLRRLVATVGLCVAAALTIVGATVGAHPTVPTVQAAAPVQVAPVGPGHPRLLPRSGTVAVMGMALAETDTPATTAPTSSAGTSTPTTTTAATPTTTASTPTGTANGTPDPTPVTTPTATPAPTTTVTPSPTTTVTPMPTTTSVATCKAVTT